MRPKPIRVFPWFLVVEGAGSFPFDMLRYDSCFPYEQEDSRMLEDHHRERRRVVLLRRGVNDGPGETRRWASFGWRVVGTFIEPSDARRLAREEAKS